MHNPVMLQEVVTALAPKDGEVYVDGTFGAGGYSRAFLEAADCTVIAIDRDPQAVGCADVLKQDFPVRFIFVRGCFGDALELVNATGFEKVDGFVLDVGVSSMQLDEAARGFSFRYDGPLDMRMDMAARVTAADIINDYPQNELADLIYRYGEERLSRRIARRIVEQRTQARIDTTAQLADIVRSVVPRSSKDKNDPATRTFQALRIAVNDELGELERGLYAAEKLLADQGRLVVVSFHSLEDGIVKAFCYQRAGYQANQSRHLPAVVHHPNPSTFSLPFRKAQEPSVDEITTNPRSRSAKLRLAIRNHHPSWPLQQKGVI